MFGKKYCKRCGNAVRKKNNFCSNCGVRLNYEEDWGLLGKTDSAEKDFFEDSFFGGFSGRMLNNMIGTTMKMLEKEMQKEIKNMEKMPGSNVRLMINGREIKFSEPQIQRRKKQVRKIPRTEFNEEQIKEFSKLSKQEPKTSLKRFGDKIIYEIEMPDVNSIKDVLINRLENSIEIKAIGKTKAYSKIIPISVPIINKNLLQGKLILELQED